MSPESLPHCASNSPDLGLSHHGLQTRRTLRPHHLLRHHLPHPRRRPGRRDHRPRSRTTHEARPHTRARRRGPDPSPSAICKPASSTPSAPARHSSPSRNPTHSPTASPKSSPPPEPSPTTAPSATSALPGWATGTSSASTRSSPACPQNQALGGFYQCKGRPSNGLLIDQAPNGAPIEVIVGYSRDHDRNVGAGTFTTRLGKGKILFHRCPDFHPVLQQRFLANALRWLTT